MAGRVVGGAPGACLWTCEHATAALPVGWSWPRGDRELRRTHWAWDPGALAVARGVRRRLGGRLVYATFSRLLADPNRRPEDETWIRRSADGRPVALNAALDSADIERRAALWSAYHALVEGEARQHPGAPVVSFHSFTPVYEGGPARRMVLGVLFDRAEAEARALAQRLARSPFPVALNEPWSGRDGLMYAPERAARVTGGPPIEIEVRNDVATDPVLRPEVVRWVADALAALWPPATPRG